MSPFLWHDLARLWRDGGHDLHATVLMGERKIASVQEIVELTTRMPPAEAGKQVVARVEVEIEVSQSEKGT